MSEQRTHVEEYRVSGGLVVSKVRQLVRAGAVRRIAIKTVDGRTVLEFPLVVGAAAALFLPFWTALAAVGALFAKLVIAVERVEPGTGGGEGARRHAREGGETSASRTPEPPVTMPAEENPLDGMSFDEQAQALEDVLSTRPADPDAWRGLAPDELGEPQLHDIGAGAVPNPDDPGHRGRH